MSTRANIEVYDHGGGEDEIGGWASSNLGVLLHHDLFGHPASVGTDLDQMLKEAKPELAALGCLHRWESQTVGALLVKLSATRNEMLIDIPTFQPCLDIQEDSDYLWRVYVGPEFGEYDVQCFRVTWDRDRGRIKQLKKLDWREEAG